ncbi:MAG: hypothetical protein ACJ75B_08310 [Flavisolibacter sp.]
MSTIIIALIIICSIATITLVLISINNKHKKRKREKLLNRFSQIGSENNMSFTSQEILQDGIIGLDGLNKKLLILESHEGNFNWTTITLEDVNACYVKKLYQATNIGTFKKRTMEEHLEKVVLQFELKDEKGKIEVPFFIFTKNHIYQLAELEQKAKYWEASLSKLLTSKLKNTA